MVKLSGKAVYKGVIIGPVAVLKKDDQQVKRTKITDVDAELARLEQAGTQAQEQLQKLYDKAVKEVGEASAAIFEVHQMMLEDDDYLDGDLYEVCCPTCGDTVCIDSDMLEEGQTTCPNCGELLEFDLEEDCGDDHCDCDK